MRPKILLACSNRWPAAARLAAAFVGAGCNVEAVCPPGHPLAKTSAASCIYRYRGLAPLRSIRRALDVSRPDFVIPCDDLSTVHLHRLYDKVRHSSESSAATRTLLERSFGDPSSFPITEARASMAALARRLGVRVPPTAVVRTKEELREWLDRNGLPAVLKADGTSGGGGVRVVYSLPEALDAWASLNSPPSAARALKEAAVKRSMRYVLPGLLRSRPVVNVQTFVSGGDANTTVACWQGKVLASITVTVIHTLEQHGAASVVRIVNNSEMSAAAETIVRELNVSGLFGFDFVIDDRTGHPYLIEVNPRATPICHLQLGSGRDLTAALSSVLAGEVPGETPSVTENEVVAFFPQEWLRNPASEFLRTAYHDVPWSQPSLIRACIQEDLRVKLWTTVSSRLKLAAGVLRKKFGFAAARQRSTGEPKAIWRLSSIGTKDKGRDG
jgi:hypothetical protein